MDEIKVQNWVKELSEPLKEILKEYLYKDPREEAVKKFYETLEEQIKPFVEEGEEFSTQKHINICVTATPEELEERKMTVTMTPLTPLGEEIIRRWNDAG